MFSMVDTQFSPRQPALIATKKVQEKESETPKQNKMEPKMESNIKFKSQTVQKTEKPT